MCKKDFNINEALKFLAEYSFIYEIPNIEIFVQNVLENIPYEWQKVLTNLSLDQVKKIPFGYCDDNWPSSLTEFLHEANKLGEYCNQYTFESSCELNLHIPDFIKRKTPSKKLHQIQNMAISIYELVEKYNCGILIDIGSGLGYLDQVVHHNFGLTTVGFESDLKKSETAKRRTETGTCSKGMHYINEKIVYTNNCKEILKQSIKNIQSMRSHCECGEFGTSSSKSWKNVIMVGLHSCGDLMHTMMKLFSDIPEIKVFLCAGCCYHKFTLTEFPISSKGKEALSQVKIEDRKWDIPVTALRLGCQISRNFWTPQNESDFVYNETCLIYRAIIQTFLKKENLVWKKPKRHLMKKNIKSFDDFVSSSLINILPSHLSKENSIKKLNEIFLKKKHLFPYVRVLNLLQMLLQPIWEGVVIADCMAYFQEVSISSDILVLCEKDITPRNLMIYGVK